MRNRAATLMVQAPPRQRAMSTRVLLVRHAAAAAASRDPVIGVPLEAPLSDRGFLQARALGRALAQLSPVVCYSSDLPRASQTAEKSAQHLGIPFFFDQRLREHYFGLWHGVPVAKLQREEPRKLECLWQPDPEFAPPRGESLRQLQERMLAAFQDAVRAHRGQTILMVSHSEALGALMCGLLGISAANIRHLHLDPCGLSIVELREDVPVLTLWNDLHHLEGLDDG